MKKISPNIQAFINTPFESASIILPVMNETSALEKTINIIENECAKDIGEYIIVVCKKTTKESLAVCNAFVNKDQKRFRLHFQNKPFLGNAIREGFMLATCSHVITMGSDLETNPHDVKHFIGQAKQHPDKVITASRWLSKGRFFDYGHTKRFMNYLFQKLFGLFYFTRLSDLTFGYRLLPTKLVQAIRWEHPKHPLILETIVKPLRLGVRVIEIPSEWHKRTEGESQNSLFVMSQYIPVAIKCRLCSRKKIVNMETS
ncbi:MAG: glycosyltransferase family 2 protein [Gammaproteobacteria bacterium]